MRRLTAFLCFLLLLLATGGRSLLFRLQLAEVRAEMRESLRQGRIPEGSETFLFDARTYASIQWLEGGKEFEWKGTRYDVLGRTNDGGSVRVRAVADHKESQLVSRYHQEKQDEPLPSKSLQKLLSVPYLVPAPVTVPLPGTVSCAYPPEGCERLHPPYVSVPDPPPLA
ncbi:hypothetical protein EPD60_02215 [Flaviaesturariibacter flavus]|uniref:Uncharacterized protein n=1 Tax=Flaviaesturariibacter flavus TaxID=2502780 RepID=A0A4R1BNT0_9BACT|nr:hypothetical protein [Flaviaesturariibacter flavus]TCJ19253.1 hypothetical protein EPD60_02215 [Flaviaesturariibacter flavus]